MQIALTQSCSARADSSEIFWSLDKNGFFFFCSPDLLEGAIFKKERYLERRKERRVGLIIKTRGANSLDGSHFSPWLLISLLHCAKVPCLASCCMRVSGDGDGDGPVRE
jgi:hypothetical protein